MYFLGRDKRWIKNNKKLPKVFIILVLILLITTLAVGGYYLNSSRHAVKNDKIEMTLQGDTLNVVSILPKGSKFPRFNGSDNIEEFYKWIGINLEYPEGYETVKAKVIVRFVIMKNGKLGMFKILKAPRNKIFESAVINLLRRSPKWKPAELADGTKVNMEFILPVSFQNLKD